MDRSPADAFFSYVQHGTYPDSDDVAADLPPSASRALREKIATARTTARAEISQLSRRVAPDVDGWIKQAQQLQSDIERSRAIAREVVQDAENAASLRSDRIEQENKLRLLRIEVEFNSTLRQTLEVNRQCASHINRGQDLAADGRLEQALEEYEKAQESLGRLRPFSATAPVQLLHNRAARLRQSLNVEITSQWDRLVRVDHESGRLSVQHDVHSSDPSLGLQSTVTLLKTSGAFDPTMRTLCQDLDNAIITPRLERRSATQSSSKIEVSDNELSVLPAASFQHDPADLLDDLTGAIEFLNQRFPPEVSSAISDSLMPDLTSRVISDWLTPSVPTALEQLPELEGLSQRVNDFADFLASAGWLGGAELNDWIRDGPKVWLSRHRESLLVLVRDVLSSRLGETKTVERVETQLVSRNDVITQSAGATGETWDDAWEEEEQPKKETPKSDAAAESNGQDEEADAWDMAAEDEKPAATNGRSHENVDEAEAWGWDEAESPTATKLPKESKDHASNNGTSKGKPQERELTLKETYTITAVPDSLLQAIIQLTHDAHALQSPIYTTSPLQAAATALYTLPTLLLAGYRALAPNYYTSLPAGNMYLYNDSVRLASELSNFSTTLSSTDPTGANRAKLPTDITALTHFSARAYGKEMEAQRTILRDLLDGAQGFANCTETPYAAECSGAVEMVVDRVRTVAAEWKPILSRSVWLQSLGSLVSTVVEKIIHDVCDLSDISEPESVALKGLCDDVSEVSDLFVQDDGGGPDMAGEDDTASSKRDMTGVYTPNWFRFQYLAEILESSLADIRYLWQEGELKLEFEVAEVVDLIEALFADSEHRRRAIADIRRS